MNFVQTSERGLEIWEIFYCYIKKPEAIIVYILRLLQGFNWLDGVQWQNARWQLWSEKNEGGLSRVEQRDPTQASLVSGRPLTLRC